jgi:hypothetical protein
MTPMLHKIRTAVADLLVMPNDQLRLHARGQRLIDAQTVDAARSPFPPRTAVARNDLMPIRRVRPHARGQDTSDAQTVCAARSSSSQV